MPDFSHLPPLERIKRYRQLASDALKEAAATEGSLKESYVLMAKQWERMAAIRSSRKFSQSLMNSRMDRVKRASKRPPWTAGSIALMVIGLLILIPAVVGTAVFGVLVAFGGSFTLIDIVLIVGGMPVVIAAAMVDASRHYRGLSSGRFGSIAFINLGAALLLLGGLIAAPFAINALGGIPLGGMDLLRSIWPNAVLGLFLLATLTLGPEPSDLMVALLIGVLPMVIGAVLIGAGLRLRRP